MLIHRVVFVNSVANGQPAGGSWYDCGVELMNEQMVYGGPVFMPIADGTNICMNMRVAKSQLPLFQHDPSRLVIPMSWWLLDIVDSARFATVNAQGCADYYNASNSLGVRPAFCIS